jgi:hypothetical protein
MNTLKGRIMNKRNEQPKKLSRAAVIKAIEQSMADQRAILRDYFAKSGTN